MDLLKRLLPSVKSRKSIALVALITTFSGFALLLDSPKGIVSEWFSLPLLIVGASLFTWAVWPSSPSQLESPSSLASRLIHRLTRGGRLVRLFPGLGAGLILADIGYNWTLSATPALQTEDTIVLFGAACLMAYRFVPPRFARERDFVLLFFGWLNVILVVPLLLARLYYADLERSVDVYSWVALAPQTSGLLNLFGVKSRIVAVAGSTAPGLLFTPEHMSVQVTVVITTACSGIYSFGIFSSAFLAFVLTEYKDITRRLWMLLGLGLLTAYVANVLRMVVIVLVGYYTDSTQTDLQNMLIAHSYAGWLIFLGWLLLFWGVLFRLMPLDDPVPPRIVSIEKVTRPATRCGICHSYMSPIVPGIRCVCGAYYHRSCWSKAERCQTCGRSSGATSGSVGGIL